MIRNYWKMKKNEWKVKAQFYGAIAAILDNQKDILAFIQRTYESLKDVPAEELQKELIRKIAEMVHRESQKETE